MDDDVVWKMRSVFRKKEEAATENSSDSPSESQWTKIRTVLMKVLGRFPEAKAAVVEGLGELCGAEYTGPIWAT